jgi:methionyl-tRNA formyltransferase
MKIEFLTQDDPIYILPFFEEFFRCYANEFEVVQISCCAIMGKRSRRQMLRELLALYRPGGFLRLISSVAISKILSKFGRSRNASRFYSIGQLARAYRTPFARIANPNADGFIEQMQLRRPEVLVSVACPFILKEKILAVAPRASINLHHAPLPRYKGMMPTFWQMYKGENTVGVTIHRMAPKLDAGATLLRAQHAIEPGESLHHLIQRSKRAGAHYMAKVLRQIAGEIPLQEISVIEEGSYFTFPTIAEIRDFHRKGLKAI